MPAGLVAAGDTQPRKGRRAELDAYIARFPRPSPAALVLSLASVVIGNGYLLWRVWQGELRMSGIVLLVLAEAVILSIVAAAQRSFVPAAHRMKSDGAHYGLPAKVISWIGFIIGIGGAYAMWAYLLKEWEAVVGYFSSWQPWRESGLHIALAVTLLFAVFGLVADHVHYRRAGPPLVSSVQLESTARRITFAYGAIVIAVPMFGTLAFALWAIPRLIGKRDTKAWNFIGGMAVIAVFFATFFGLARLVDSGVFGWALVYLWGKTLVEGLFVALPVLAKRPAPARG